MADTIRNLTDLLALLADNATGDISPQDVRDMLVSLHSVRGEMYIADNSGGTPQSIGTSFAKITQLTSKGQENGTTVDNAGDSDIQVTTAGVYVCYFSVSFSGAANSTFEVSVFKGGVEQTNVKLSRKLGGGGDVGNSSASGMISCAASDLLDIRAKADGAGKDFLIQQGQFHVTRIA